MTPSPAPPSPFAGEAGGFWSKLFDTSDYPPRWSCGEWTAAEGWLHIVSDVLIWGAYTCIPFALLYFVRRRQDAPLKLVFTLFAVFILSCGTTHLLEAVLFWHPIYRLAGLVKALTAVVSILTVVVLLRALPVALELRGPAELATVVEQRTRELEDSRREADAARQQAEHLSRSRGTFLAGLHAEARTPLNAILGHAKRLASPEISDAERRKSAQSILWHGRHQGRVLGDALQAASSSRPRPEIRPAPFEVRTLVDQAIDMTTRAVGLTGDGTEPPIRVHIPDEVPRRCNADALRLRQTLVNLLETALAGASEPLSMEISAEYRSQGSERGWLCFRVRAEGLTISDEGMDVVFKASREGAEADVDPGRSNWADLVLARRIVEALGGELRVELAEGSPAVLIAEVPVREVLSDGAAEFEAASYESTRLEPVPIRVLAVALPSPFTERAIEHIQRIGGQVQSVATPNAAGAAVAAARTAGSPFHSVVVDLDLPDLDLRALRGALERAGLPEALIGVTYYAAERMKETGPLSAPPLVKPVAADNLFEALASALDGQNPDDAALAGALQRHASDERERRRADD